MPPVPTVWRDFHSCDKCSVIKAAKNITKKVTDNRCHGQGACRGSVNKVKHNYAGKEEIRL